jgi:hypothetical protein
VVLTFAQGGTEQERFSTYLKAGKCWDLLRKKLTWRYDAIAYIQTWERHKKGGCHANLVMGNPQIFHQVKEDWKAWRRNTLIPLAVAAGFGPVAWVELCDGETGRLAGYLTKLAAELTDSAGKNQVPVDAPPHFRRIRASRGILPPKPDTDLTGELAKIPVPEYSYNKSGQYQGCGLVGEPITAKKGKSHATNQSVMA